MPKVIRPSDRLTPKQKFQRDQLDMFRAEHHRAVIMRLADLSPAQKQRLIVAAPAFVAGEGSR